MKTSITLLLLFSVLATVLGQIVDQQEDSLIMEVWDESTEEWATFGKAEFTYNVNGQMIVSIGYYADEDKNWVPIEKTEHTYNTNGNRIRSTEYEDWEGAGE